MLKGIQDAILNIFSQKVSQTTNTPSTQTSFWSDPNNEKLFDRAVIFNENNVADTTGQNLYKIKGVTGDLGKYQVSPTTLSTYSKMLLGKVYTPQQFINNPKVQEEFYNQFKQQVVKKYDLTPEQGLVAWHRGIGTVTNPYQSYYDKNNKLQTLKDATGTPVPTNTVYQQRYLNNFLNNKLQNDPEAQGYVNKAKPILTGGVTQTNTPPVNSNTGFQLKKTAKGYTQ